MCNISVVCLQLDLKFSLPRAPCCEISPHLLYLSTRSRPPHKSYRVIVPSLQDGLWDGNRDSFGRSGGILGAQTLARNSSCCFCCRGSRRITDYWTNMYCLRSTEKLGQKLPSPKSLNLSPLICFVCGIIDPIIHLVGFFLWLVSIKSLF